MVCWQVASCDGPNCLFTFPTFMFLSQRKWQSCFIPFNKWQADEDTEVVRMLLLPTELQQNQEMTRAAIQKHPLWNV